MKLSIIVPVYRSQNIVPLLVARVDAMARSLNLHGSFELILVNDASPDGSWEVIKEQAGEFSFIKGISLTKNFGQHNAVMAGLSACSGEIVVIMDDDLQHPPESIPEMVASIEAGADVCYTKYLERKHQLWKKAGSFFNHLVANALIEKPKDLYLSSFKAIRGSIAKEVIKYDGPYVYLDGIILGITRRIVSISIKHGDRHDGEGNYNLRRSISLWLKMATSFSVLPLRFASVIGMIVALLSMLSIISIFIMKFTHPGIATGWPSLIAATLFMGGVQLLFLGVIGEYLGRTYLKINNKPQYVVRETTESN
jgi:glycosyltransferase involved in cell wall biosynthesis